MKFETTKIQITSRKLEPELKDNDFKLDVKQYERVNLTIELTGIGDTKDFTSAELLDLISHKLKSIEKKKK